MNKKIRKIISKIKPIYRLLKLINRKLKGIRENQQCIATEQLDAILEIIGKNKLVLEIGTFKGQTTSRIAENNDIVGVEPFEAYEDDMLMGTYPEDVSKDFIKNNKGKNVLLFPTTSKKAFEFWDKNIKRDFDCIFIDGLHTYEGVKQDSKWLKYLKEEGIVIFDDTKICEVKRFVDEEITPNYFLLKDVKGTKIFKEYKKSNEQIQEKERLNNE